jgi:ATP-dependent DNA helicase RecG
MEGKGLPDLSKSDAFSVRLKIPATVKDKNFILFLEKVANEKQIVFSFDEIFELEILRESKSLTKLKNKDKFLSLGIVEKIGRTSGARYILSHKYFLYEGKPGIYTKISGISREKQKEFIVKHLQKYGKGTRAEFKEIFPELKQMDISNMLQELRREERISRVGHSKKGYWEIRK